MRDRPRWETGAIVALLLIEAAVFTGSFGKFFNHDSLFYLIHAPRGWEEAGALLLAPDSSRQYRPLTLVFAAPFVRLWGTNPRPYHWIPLLFHLANSWLLFRLAGRLVRPSIVPLAAAYFWGLHSVAGWVVYDMTCISDLLSAFLLFSFLILAIDGVKSGSRPRAVASFFLFALSLLTKETATAFPLALLVCLVAADVRDSAEPPHWREITKAVRRAAVPVAVSLGAAIAFAAVLVHWFRSGLLYTQGPTAAYDLSPLSNLSAKSRYLWWSLNLPDHSWPDGRVTSALLLAGFVALLWILDLLRRRLRLGALECGGLLWFAGLCLPALTLSSRLAKWYLYVPAAGIALAFGVFAENFRRYLSRRSQLLAAPAVAALLFVPFLAASLIQIRTYLSASDAAYVSDSLKTRVAEFGDLAARLPERATLFFLPDFEDTSRLLSAPPIGDGQLFTLFYPGREFHTLFAARNDALPPDHRERGDVRIIQFLDGRFHDVTQYQRTGGTMTLFLLRTSEGRTPPLLESPPAGGWTLYGKYVRLMLEDRGDRLPADYERRPDLWILQYLNGHFYDVTDYQKGRLRSPARRLIGDPDQLQVSVSRAEFYPAYDRFDTPNSRPVFFSTPQRDILTQIGGSTAVTPIGIVPPRATLHFDISWMHDTGDGGWAELRVRTGSGESPLYQEYMRPNPRGQGFRWKEVTLDLSALSGKPASLILRCYNSPGKNTVSDWLNWRDLALEAAPTPGTPASLQATIAPE